MVNITRVLRILLSTLSLLTPLLATAQSVGPSDLGTINGSLQQNIADSFGALSAPTNPLLPYNFTDAYTFTVTNTITTGGFVATLNLGTLYNISNLQAAVFVDPANNGITAAGQYLYNTGSTGATAGLAWTGESGSLISLDSTGTIAPGSYTLEIRGDVTGSTGGNYVGILNISAVPEASTFALALAGLGAVGLVVARRRNV